MAGLRPTVIDMSATADKRCVHYAHEGAPGPLRLIQYGWFVKKDGGRGYQIQGPMTRPYFLIHFVCAGKGRVVIGDTEYRVQAGQYFVFFPNQITYYESDPEDPWEYYWLAYDGDAAEAIMREAGITARNAVRFIPHAQSVFAALRSVRETTLDSSAYLLITAQLYACLHYLTEGQWDEGEDEPVQSRRCPEFLTNEYVRMVTECIAQNYGQPISVTEIANRMGLNRSYLTSVFRKHMGRTIKEYLTQYRIEQVKILLQHENYSVKRAAMECGFSDPLHFSLVFREKVGVSPMEYRKGLVPEAGGHAHDGQDPRAGE